MLGWRCWQCKHRDGAFNLPFENFPLTASKYVVKNNLFYSQPIPLLGAPLLMNINKAMVKNLL